MPFANYRDFEDCVAHNQDKRDPEAYCAAIKAKAEGFVTNAQKPTKATVVKAKVEEHRGPTPRPPNRIVVAGKRKHTLFRGR